MNFCIPLNAIRNNNKPFVEKIIYLFMLRIGQFTPFTYPNYDHLVTFPFDPILLSVNTFHHQYQDNKYTLGTLQGLFDNYSEKYDGDDDDEDEEQNNKFMFDFEIFKLRQNCVQKHRKSLTAKKKCQNQHQHQHQHQPMTIENNSTSSGRKMHKKHHGKAKDITDFFSPNGFHPIFGEQKQHDDNNNNQFFPSTTITSDKDVDEPSSCCDENKSRKKMKLSPESSVEKTMTKTTLRQQQLSCPNKQSSLHGVYSNNNNNNNALERKFQKYMHNHTLKRDLDYFMKNRDANKILKETNVVFDTIGTTTNNDPDHNHQDMNDSKKSDVVCDEMVNQQQQQTQAIVEQQFSTTTKQPKSSSKQRRNTLVDVNEGVLNSESFQNLCTQLLKKLMSMEQNEKRQEQQQQQLRTTTSSFHSLLNDHSVDTTTKCSRFIELIDNYIERLSTSSLFFRPLFDTNGKRRNNPVRKQMKNKFWKEFIQSGCQILFDKKSKKKDVKKWQRKLNEQLQKINSLANKQLPHSISVVHLNWDKILNLLITGKEVPKRNDDATIQHQQQHQQPSSFFCHSGENNNIDETFYKTVQFVSINNHNNTNVDEHEEEPFKLTSKSNNLSTLINTTTITTTSSNDADDDDENKSDDNRNAEHDNNSKSPFLSTRFSMIDTQTLQDLIDIISILVNENQRLCQQQQQCISNNENNKIPLNNSTTTTYDEQQPSSVSTFRQLFSSSEFEKSLSKEIKKCVEKSFCAMNNDLKRESISYRGNPQRNYEYYHPPPTAATLFRPPPSQNSLLTSPVFPVSNDGNNNNNLHQQLTIASNELCKQQQQYSERFHSSLHHQNTETSSPYSPFIFNNTSLIQQQQQHYFFDTRYLQSLLQNFYIDDVLKFLTLKMVTLPPLLFNPYLPSSSPSFLHSPIYYDNTNMVVNPDFPQTTPQFCSPDDFREGTMMTSSSLSENIVFDPQRQETPTSVNNHHKNDKKNNDDVIEMINEKERLKIGAGYVILKQ